MKPEEAIERLEYLESALDGYPPETGINDVFAAIDTAIEALKEVQQYREIGTVEECRGAVEKQKVKYIKIEAYCPAYCPTCRFELSESLGDGYYKYFENLSRCPKCGQKICWDENLEEME